MPLGDIQGKVAWHWRVRVGRGVSRDINQSCWLGSLHFRAEERSQTSAWAGTQVTRPSDKSISSQILLTRDYKRSGEQAKLQQQWWGVVKEKWRRGRNNGWINLECLDAVISAGVCFFVLSCSRELAVFYIMMCRTRQCRIATSYHAIHHQSPPSTQ